MAIDMTEVTRPSPKNPLGGALVVFTVTALIVAGAAMLASGIAITRADDATDQAVQAATGVTVTLTEYALTPKAVNVPVNGTITVKNAGTIDHNLAVKGTNKASKMLKPGDTTTLKLDGLKAGEYTMICQVSGHDLQGMTGTINIGGSGSMDGMSMGSGSSASPAGTKAGQRTAASDAMDAQMAVNTNKYLGAATGKTPPLTKGVGSQDLPAQVAPDGAKVFNLTAKEIDWEVAPGQTVKAMAYNDQVPGPTLRVSSGDRVRVVLNNQMAESTSIHFHGITTPNDMDGVPDVTQAPVRPGETFTYEFTAKGPAVGMYHSHQDAVYQVPAGLAGAFLIDQEPVPRGVTVNQELTMMLNDTNPIGLTLNGKSFPATQAIAANQGDWIMMHYLNEGGQIHPMHLHGIKQTVIAKDGFPLDSPYDADTIMVAPGERYTVLINATEPGAWAWHCHILPHAETREGMFGMVTALVVQ